MKVMTVVGARPQFVKAAVLSRALARSRPDIQEVLVHTGQHYDANMSDVFFSEMEIPHPNHSLGIGGGTHGQNTGRMLEAIERLAIENRPNWMVVYGDTDSTLAGALAAAKLHIPIAHVEAGLRSYNRRMPEEINRVLTDHVSTLLWAPTDTALRNLLSEGIVLERVQVTGDVMYDAALYYGKCARPPLWASQLGIVNGRFVLCTIHRAENTDSASKLAGILEGLASSTLPVVLPLHPRTRKCVTAAGLGVPDNVSIVEPVGYLEMVWLEMACDLIITDSGGVQKEAYFNAKPCLTLREETEWVELVNSGWNRLVGSDPLRISEGLSELRVPDSRPAFYGNGDAGEKMAEGLR